MVPRHDDDLARSVPGRDLVNRLSNPVKTDYSINSRNELPGGEKAGQEGEVLGSGGGSEPVERCVRSLHGTLDSGLVEQWSQPTIGHRPTDAYISCSRSQDGADFGGGSITHEIDHYVVLVARHDKILMQIVNDAMGTQCARLFDVARAAHCGYVTCTEYLRELHRKRSDPSSSAVDQNAIAKFHCTVCLQCLQCCKPGHRCRGGGLKLDSRRESGHKGRVHCGVFCEASSAGSEDCIADLEADRIRSDGLDNSGHICTLNQTFRFEQPCKQSQEVWCAAEHMPIERVGR